MASHSEQNSIVSSVVTNNGLMPPPPPRIPKRKQETVLEEDEWIAKLEGIIERDFFPELGRLQDKVQWLEAIRGGDPEAIRHAQLKIAQRRNGGTTPFTATRRRYHDDLQHSARGIDNDNDGHTVDGEGEEENETTVPIPNMSLDAFLSHHTSEDNASFQLILDRVNKRRRERAMQRNGPTSNSRIVDKEMPLALTWSNPEYHDKKTGNNPQRERTSDGFGSTGQPDDRLIGWKYAPTNLFMNNGSRDSLPLSRKERESMAAGPPRGINHSATRLRPKQQTVYMTGSRGGEGMAIECTPSSSSVGTESSAMSSDERRIDSLERAGMAKTAKKGAQHAQHGGVDPARYAIVSTPSFDPGVDATPFMTWGEIDATPLRIEEEDDVGDMLGGHALRGGGMYSNNNAFKIGATPRREVLAHDLAAKVSGSFKKTRNNSRRKARLGSGGGGGSVGSTTPAVHAMAAIQSVHGERNSRGAGRQSSSTPLSAAAQRLAGSMRKGKGGADRVLRASYSGTPARGSGQGGAGSGGGGGWDATPSHAWTPSH